MLIALIGYSGIRMIVEEFSSRLGVHVNRSEMLDLNTAARHRAGESVEMVGGDLSWLDEELPALESFRVEKPLVTTRVFYDRRRVSPSRFRQISQLQDLGILPVPYPPGMSPPFKGMVVDREDLEGRKLYLYSRRAPAPVGKSRDFDRFKWEEFGSESGPFMDAVSSFLKTALSVQKVPVRIAISGANNAGKTSLANALKGALSEHLTVSVFVDAFRTSGSGTQLEDNLLALITQILDSQSVDSDVAIYDRTFVDTLCFLCLKTPDRERIYNLLAPRLAAAMGAFSLVVDVRRHSDDYTTSTKLVTGEDRRFIREILDQFFATYGIATHEVIISRDRFEESITEHAQELAMEVESMVQYRKALGL